VSPTGYRTDKALLEPANIWIQQCELTEASIHCFLPTKSTPHKIPIQFLVLILFSFHRENGSTINSFHTKALNSLKPSWCTPTHRELSNDNKSVAWSVVIWEISLTKLVHLYSSRAFQLSNDNKSAAWCVVIWEISLTKLVHPYSSRAFQR
jgi:hypothetical protein